MQPNMRKGSADSSTTPKRIIKWRPRLYLVRYTYAPFMTISLDCFTVDGNPHLCFIATKEIKSGVEILYDSGERNKDIVDSWLAK